MRAALAPLLQVDGPEQWPAMVEVKASTVRTVLRGQLTGPGGRPLGVHVKAFRAVRLSDHARDAVTGSRAAREFDNLLEARARGLGAVRPLAAGTFRGSHGSRSFLVTETVPDGAPLSSGPLPAAQARAAGALLRRAHDAGLHARDLHPGNLLVDAAGRPWLLDLTSAVFADPPERPDRARALAFFCQGLDGGVADPASAPLVESYGADGDLVLEAVRLGRRFRRRGLTAFGRRAFRSCRHTIVEPPVRGRPQWFFHVPAADLHDDARRLGEPDPLEALKSGRRGAVYLGDRVVSKSRTAAAARRLFRSSYWLVFAKVPCPQPVALRVHLGRGLVATRRLPGPTLEEEMRAGSILDSDLRAAARNLGDAVGRLHAHGLRNRDLKFDNLIRDPSDNRVYMVDLDGIRRKATLDRRGRGGDLGRLLAAFRAAGSPGGLGVMAAFRRGYNAAQQCLSFPRNARNDRYLWRLSEARATAWASAHPSSSGS